MGAGPPAWGVCSRWPQTHTPWPLHLPQNSQASSRTTVKVVGGGAASARETGGRVRGLSEGRRPAASALHQKWALSCTCHSPDPTSATLLLPVCHMGDARGVLGLSSHPKWAARAPPSEPGSLGQ